MGANKTFKVFCVAIVIQGELYVNRKPEGPGTQSGNVGLFHMDAHAHF
jgi:hypothetical protein